MIFDDGPALYKRGKRFLSKKMDGFEIVEERMPATPVSVVRKLHPNGVIKEVKV